MACATCRPPHLEPFTIIDSPAAWKASDFKSVDDFAYTFTESDLAEIEAAVEAVLATGKPINVSSMCE